MLIGSVTVERTNDASQDTQRLAAIVQLSDKITQDLGVATRGAALYVRKRNPNDLASYRSAKAAYAVEVPRFRGLIATFPSLQTASVAYVSKLNSGMALIARYLAVYDAGGRASADRFARSSVARDFGPQLQRVQIQFDQVMQARTLLQASVSRGSLHGVELWLGLCASVALALSLVAAMLF
ncbi:MAG: hypothetical protein ACREML_03985, partial [Vulcanimicrobiaceae bacterium]